MNDQAILQSPHCPQCGTTMHHLLNGVIMCPQCGSRDKILFDELGKLARQRDELLDLNANLEKDYRESEQERDRLKIRCNELATAVRVSSEALEKERESNAWKISPAMAEAKIEQLNVEKDRKVHLLNEMISEVADLRVSLKNMTAELNGVRVTLGCMESELEGQKRAFVLVDDQRHELERRLKQLTADRDAARLQAERLLDAGRWIPISEKWPTEADGILIRGRSSVLWKFVDDSMVIFAWDYQFGNAKLVTHWCRLSALPKEEKKEPFDAWFSEYCKVNRGAGSLECGQDDLQAAVRAAWDAARSSI